MEKPHSVFDLAHQIRYYGAQLINTYDKSEALLIVCGFIIITFFLKNFFRYLSSYFLIPLRNGIIRNIRTQLFNKYLSLPLKYHDQHSRGDLISRVNNDILEVEWSILSALEVIFKSPLIMLGALIFMIYISPQLSIFVFVLLLITIFIVGFLARKLKQDSGEIQSSLGKLTALLEQSLIGLPTIKSYNAQSFMQSKFEEHNDKIYNKVSNLLRRRDLSSPISEFFGVTIVTVLLFYGAKLVFDNTLEAETFFAFIFAFYQIIEPAKSFSSAYYNLKKGLAAVDRIEQIIDSPETESVDGGSGFPKEWQTLSFDQVTFQYEGQKDPGLTGVSFSINKGDKLAIVGSSGSGKSTILKLILRHYIENQGQISLDGLDIKDINLNSLRERVAIVDQDPILFNDTIEANIYLGRPVDTNQLNNVLQIAQLEHFIDNQSLGLKHNVGDSGTLLSGGEKQRISISRSLYGNPDIILFDEATSALDAKSEKLVTDAVANAIADRTAIIVAHRLSTLNLANKVLVMEDGRVKEFGYLEDLNQEGTIFRSYLNTFTGS